MNLELLTVAQVASFLQYSERTVLRKIHNGDLRASKLGKSWRIRSDDMEQYLSNFSNEPLNVKKKRTRGFISSRKNSCASPRLISFHLVSRLLLQFHDALLCVLLIQTPDHTHRANSHRTILLFHYLFHLDL